MLLNKHQHYQKKLIALREEDQQNDKEVRNQIIIDIEPYRWGWDIYADLRQEEKRRMDSTGMLKAISIGYRSYHTTDVNVIRALRSGSKSVRGKKRSKKQAISFRAAKRRWFRKKREEWRWFYGYDSDQFYNQTVEQYRQGGEHSIIPQPQNISEKEYLTLTPDVKKWFSLDDYNKLSSWWKPSYKICIPQHLIVARAEVRWVEKTRIPNGEALSKSKHLDNQMDKLIYRGYAHDRWYSYGDGRESSRAKASARTQRRILITRFKKNEIEEDHLFINNNFKNRY